MTGGVGQHPSITPPAVGIVSVTVNSRHERPKYGTYEDMGPNLVLAHLPSHGEANHAWRAKPT